MSTAPGRWRVLNRTGTLASAGFSRAFGRREIATKGRPLPDQMAAIWTPFASNAQAVGVVLAAAGSLLYATTKFVSKQVELEKEVEIQRTEMAKEVEILRTEMAKEAEKAKAEAEKAKAEVEKAKREVEKAKRETAERFLTYGYAEEFQRYQKQVGIYKDADVKRNDE